MSFVLCNDVLLARTQAECSDGFLWLSRRSGPSDVNVIDTHLGENYFIPIVMLRRPFLSQIINIAAHRLKMCQERRMARILQLQLRPINSTVRSHGILAGNVNSIIQMTLDIRPASVEYFVLPSGRGAGRSERRMSMLL